MFGIASASFSEHLVTKASLVLFKLATFTKDAAQHFGNDENHLSMRDLMADRSRDPFTGGSHASLMAGRAEVAGFAGEG